MSEMLEQNTFDVESLTVLELGKKEMSRMCEGNPCK